MVYQKFIPALVLQPFVECYFIWDSEKPVSHVAIESPPNGFCSMVFNFGDDYFIQNKKYEKLRVPKHFIAGQSIYSYKLLMNGIIDMAGIVFKPAGIASLYDLPVYEYTEERLPLDNILPQYILHPAIQRLEKNNANERARLLEQFVMDQFEKNKPIPDFIDKAANLIIEKNGMTDITQMMKDVFMSRRNFERKFFKKVGLSPKFYARLRRLAHLMNLIAGKKHVDWNEIFSAAEFYDQSHFIKDFIEFTGRTPQQYLKENTELATMIPKPEMLAIH
jgi:AraC-like DNA-binding protein